MNDERGVILPERDYEDAAEIHGRPRILADFEKQARQASVLERARQRIQERD